MGYKRKLFSDKTIVAAAAVGVIAVSAIVGGALLTGQEDNGNKAPIVDLSEDMTGGNGFSLAEEDTTGEDESGLVVSDQNKVTAVNPDDESELEGNQTDGEDAEANGGQDDAESDGDISGETEGESEENSALHGENNNGQDTGEASGLVGVGFNVSSTLVWPVEGNVLIDYDMENTVYFATLDLYKCSDAVYIQSEVGTPVYAGHACVIEEISYDEEIGNNVTVSMGNGYMLTYGQLKDVQIEKGAEIEEGDLIGYVGSPTKYYTVEGAHLYMKMTENGNPVDPLDYLNYED